MVDTEQQMTRWHRPRPWISLIAIIILLIFLYFFKPFESYISTHIPHIHFSNVMFWFASVVAVIGYLVAHWQSFRQHIYGHRNQLDVEALVFDALQVALLTAVILCAGAILQAVEMLGEHLMNRGPIFDGGFGEKLLAIILLVILAVGFYLLHYMVRAVRKGWTPRHPPTRMSGPG